MTAGTVRGVTVLTSSSDGLPSPRHQPSTGSIDGTLVSLTGWCRLPTTGGNTGGTLGLRSPPGDVRVLDEEEKR